MFISSSTVLMKRKDAFPSVLGCCDVPSKVVIVKQMDHVSKKRKEKKKLLLNVTKSLLIWAGPNRSGKLLFVLSCRLKACSTAIIFKASSIISLLEHQPSDYSGQSSAFPIKTNSPGNAASNLVLAWASTDLLGGISLVWHHVWWHSDWIYNEDLF